MIRLSEETMRRTAILVIALLAASPSAAPQTEDLDVLTRSIAWADAPARLQLHLNTLAFELLDRRRGEVAQLRTAADWERRRAQVRAALGRVLGAFPERTPLRPRVMGTVEKDGFRIEKIVFESQPAFYVTGCLFLPSNRPPRAPAILNVIGHADVSFRAPMYQQLILNLVGKGFIVFAVDPVGQGERLQYYDPAAKRSTVGGATAEHSTFGYQCFLAGSSAARTFAWDGIRALDYLASRPEVDPERLGVTGISGGGTQTSYLAALDERVAAAAPACYITSFRRLFESIGPQDAEQNFNGGVAAGLDHADLLEARAPKPTLLVATTRDFFSIEGTRETFAEAQGAFRALGAPGNLALVEDDFGHGYTRKTREAIYRFFQKALSLPGRADDEEIPPLPVEDLKVTPSGQVSDSLGGETVFSLNRAEAATLGARLAERRQDLAAHLERVRREAARLTGYRAPQGPGRAVFRGRWGRDGYSVEMLALEGEGRSVIPLLVFVPNASGRQRTLVYLHPQGKSAEAAPGREIERLVMGRRNESAATRGMVVAAPDLSGTGELGRVSNGVAFLAEQIGRSVVGVRAAEIARVAGYLKTRSDVAADEIYATGREGTAIALLHAAAFDTSLRGIALLRPLVGYRSVVATLQYKLEPADLLASVLTEYDLPDLAATLVPRPLLIVDPRDGAGAPLDTPAYHVALDSYRAANAAARYRYVERLDVTPDEAIARWLDQIRP
jgi:dienelactone hydrolase